jgi:hypothetical protein
LRLSLIDLDEHINGFGVIHTYWREI